MLTLGRYAEVTAVLADPGFEVPPVPPLGPDVGLAWLRATVARFSTGPAHQRRRALAQRDLDRLAPATLRAQAAAHPMDDPEGVPVDVLAAALGTRVPLSRTVATVAAGYLTGDGGPAADAAVRDLVAAFGGVPDEATAARVGLLVQASAATAALIRNALRAADGGAPTADIPALLTEVLRFDPPVPAMRRVCTAGTATIPAGTPVLLDIAAANRDPAVFRDPDTFDVTRPDAHLTFGAGLRPCPGRDHAFALATGVVERLLQEVHT